MIRSDDNFSRTSGPETVWQRVGCHLCVLVLFGIGETTSCMGQIPSYQPPQSVPQPVAEYPSGNATGYSSAWANYRAAPIGGYSIFASQEQQSSNWYTSPINSDLNVCETQSCSSEACAPCCKAPCDECGRHLAFDVSPGFFFRSDPKPQLLFSSAGGGTGRTDASQFDFDFASGIDFGVIGYEMAATMDLEFRLTWVDQWASAVGTNFTGTTVEISGDPPLATTGPRTGVTSYLSEYRSAEFNFRQRLDPTSGVTVVAGFRSIRVDEWLNGRLVDPAGGVPDELVQANVQNRLYGVQIGADYVVRNCCDWCLRIDGRLGMYGNGGNQKSNLISLATPPVVFPAIGSADSLSFHAEFGVECRRRLFQDVNLLAGWRVLVIDGLALASEQPGATSFLTQSGYHSNSTVVLNSLTVGLEVVY